MIIEDFKNSICLESYTSSPGYYGHFYYIGDKIRHGGEIAISILDNLVRKEIEFGVSAISSLTLGCFPGQYYDAESGLHYNYFRGHDRRLGGMSKVILLAYPAD